MLGIKRRRGTRWAEPSASLWKTVVEELRLFSAPNVLPDGCVFAVGRVDSQQVLKNPSAFCGRVSAFIVRATQCLPHAELSSVIMTRTSSTTRLRMLREKVFIVYLFLVGGNLP